MLDFALPGTPVSWSQSNGISPRNRALLHKSMGARLPSLPHRGAGVQRQHSGQQADLRLSTRSREKGASPQRKATVPLAENSLHVLKRRGFGGLFGQVRVEKTCDPRKHLGFPVAL